MSRIFAILFLTCACWSLQAQVNYVLNPSLEKYSQCPTFIDQIKYADFWSPIDTVEGDPICSPEYCNTCAGSGGLIGVPIGGWYNHYPRTGNGMAELIMYFDETFTAPYKRDYLQGRLYKSLISGKSYCITFYTVLGQGSDYAVNNIGAYLDDGSIDIGQDSVGCASPQTTFIPQIIKSTVISDTFSWSKVQGSYTANGNERFITIGNFFDKAHTTAITLHHSTSHGSIYLVDDVSIIESTTVADAGPDQWVSPGSDSVWIGSHEEGLPCEWYIGSSVSPINYADGFKVHPDTTTKYVMKLDLCSNVTYDTVTVFAALAGLNNVRAQEQNYYLYPSPNDGNFTIQQITSDKEPVNLEISDAVGRRVYSDVVRFTGPIKLLNCGSIPSGVYILQIRDSQKRSFRFKFVVSE